MIRLMSLVVFREYEYLKTYTALLPRFVTCKLYRVILHGVNIEWQYIGSTTRFHSKRFYCFQTYGCSRFQ